MSPPRPAAGDVDTRSDPDRERAVTPDRSAYIGRVLGGRYRLTASLGTGASAHVYVAEDVSLRREVAVKVLHPALAGDERFLRRFRAEAQAVASLRHPSIMSVYDWGEDDNGPYLVLEYLAGGSLRSLLDREVRLTPSQALLVGLQTAEALDHAHRKGLVHRDIKPANLLFDEEGRLAVADFGLARALAEAAWTEPLGAVLGTARYASPEQATGSPLDGRADVYSLAIVLYEAVTGTVPFAADTTLGTLMARVGKQVTAPPELGPLGPAVEAATRPEPADRPDAAGFGRLLSAAARSLPRPEALPIAVTVARASSPAMSPVTSPAGTDPEGAAPASGPDVVDLRDADEITAIGPVPSSSGLFDAADYDSDPVPVASPLPDGDDDTFADVRQRRRRRWPAILLAVVLLGALGTGGVLYAMGATKPSHPVPSLVGKTVDEADAALSPLHLRVRTGQPQFDESAEKGKIVSQAVPVDAKRREGTSILVVVSLGPAPRDVPDLTNKTQDEANAALTSLGFLPSFVPATSQTVEAGRVVDWTPKGSRDKGDTVTVTISSGRPTHPIPKLEGQTPAQAEAALKGLGFVPARGPDAFSDTVASGQVIGTAPGAGEAVAEGATVTYTVSKGPDTVVIPTSIVGKTFAQASAILQNAGLVPAGPFGPPGAQRVTTTAPSPGAKVKRGTVVNVYLA